MNPTSLLTGLGAAITGEPALGGVNSAGESSSGSGDLFMSLVAAMLQVDAAPADPTAPGAQGAPADATDPTAVPTAGSEAGAVPVPGQPAADGAPVVEPLPDGATSQPAADVLAALGYAVAPIVAQAVAAQPAPSSPTSPAAAAPAAVASAVEATSSPAPAPAAPQAAPAAAAAPTAAPAPTAPTGADAQATTAGGDDAADRETAGTQQAAAPSTAHTARPTHDTAPTAPTAVTAAPTVTSTAAPAPVATAPAQPAQRVTSQVFPEVVRVAGAEGGPQRVTVKLNPESLGEVRIVLTQRRGELEVSLSGGKEARQALTEGAPELRRLLESVGRGDSRIIIRDLPSGASAPASGTPSMRNDVSTDLTGGAWSGTGRPGSEATTDQDGPRQQHHAGSNPNATDGTPSATPSSRPITTAGRSHSGVDLTM